jgi:hypothetical protein
VQSAERQDTKEVFFAVAKLFDMSRFHGPGWLIGSAVVFLGVLMLVCPSSSSKMPGGHARHPESTVSTHKVCVRGLCMNLPCAIIPACERRAADCLTNLKLRGGGGPDTGGQDMSQPSEDFEDKGRENGWSDELEENADFDAEPPMEWLEEAVATASQDERSRGMSREQLESMARAFWKQSVMQEEQWDQVGEKSKASLGPLAANEMLLTHA